MHIEKEKFQEAIVKIGHDERSHWTYKNKDIDESKSVFNFNFVEKPVEIFKKRLDEIYIHGRNGKNKDNINCLCSVCVQRPDNCPIDDIDFFNSMFNVLADEFGIENVVSAAVHFDEPGKPHMHFKFVPVVSLEKPKNFKEKTYTEKLCAKDVINRDYLRKFHAKIEEKLEQECGTKISLRSAETRQYINDIYEFKKFKDEYDEIVKKKKAVEIEIADLEQVQKDYNDLIDNYNKLVDNFNAMAECIRRINHYFDTHQNCLKSIEEQEIEQELPNINKEMNQVIEQISRG